MNATLIWVAPLRNPSGMQMEITQQGSNTAWKQRCKANLFSAPRLNKVLIPVPDYDWPRFTHKTFPTENVRQIAIITSPVGLKKIKKKLRKSIFSCNFGWAAWQKSTANYSSRAGWRE